MRVTDSESPQRATQHTLVINLWAILPTCIPTLFSSLEQGGLSRQRIDWSGPLLPAQSATRTTSPQRHLLIDQLQPEPL